MPSSYVLSNGVFVPLSYSIAEVDAMFSVVPISRFGDTTDDPIPYSVAGSGNGAAVTLGKIPLFLAGRRYVIQNAVVPVGSTAADTFYLYAKLTEGNVGILVSKTPLDETITQMYIGTVVLGTGGSLSTAGVTLEKVTRIDIYRLSATRRGTAIPVSTGDPTGTGNFAW